MSKAHKLYSRYSPLAFALIAYRYGGHEYAEKYPQLFNRRPY